MGLDALKAWAEGKHGFLAHHAQWAAVTAPDCYTLCRMAQSEELFIAVRERVTPSIWLRFYRGKRTALERAWGTYSKEHEFPKNLQESHKAAVSAWAKVDGKFVVGAKKNRDVEERYWRAIEAWHYEQLGQTEPDKSFGNLFVDDPSFAFAFRVEIPHFLIWGRPVRKLYQEARLGNPESIGRILRLDPITIEDTRIRERKLAILREGGEDAKTLKSELEHDNSRLITLGNMKVLLAAHAVKMSIAIERFLKDLAKRTPGMKVRRIRFGTPDIRTLFDAVAQDFFGKEEDKDIPEWDEGLSKALQRAQKFWPTIKPDKK